MDLVKSKGIESTKLRMYSVQPVFAGFVFNRTSSIIIRGDVSRNVYSIVPTDIFKTRELTQAIQFESRFGHDTKVM